ncbi:hypothetical protein ACIQ9P_03965 [Kitasatospora sp. NPDC094019]|uniref:hypothetical protein n=1 Tax=Kitasatospora sp. NPDC094019 TaxID=3364091 RepID=UPI00380385D2
MLLSNAVEPTRLLTDLAPWVVVREGERRADPPLVMTPCGLAYADETAYDRDEHGLLWARWTGRCEGRPQLANVHSARQRRAKRRSLCQGCKKPADSDENGVLWLVENGRAADWPDWPEQMITMHPPTCLPCADTARDHCPHLKRTGSVLMRVRRPELAGIRGHLYRPGEGVPVRGEIVEVEYGDPRSRFVLAEHQLVALEGCTILNGSYGQRS